MIKKLLVFMAVLFVSSIMVSCGGDPIPVKPMIEAKDAISAADEFNASEYAPEDYKAAVKKLEGSHHYAIKTKKFGHANDAAVDAKELAEKALEKAAPLMIEATLEEAKTKLKDAKDANAEEFAPDEYQKAQIEIQQAELTLTQKKYMDSKESAESAKATAMEAYNISVGKKEVVKDAILEVKQKLKDAKAYGADQIAPKKMKNANSKLKSAATAYKANNLVASYKDINEAKVIADELYLMVIEKAANDKIKEAGALYVQAKDSKGATLAPDELSASKELLDTAQAHYNDTMYPEAVNSAKESIELSKVVLAAAGQAAETTPVADIDALEETDDYWVHKVVWKNTLRSIAKMFYNNEMKWKHIYNTNKDKIKNPDKIIPGWKLIVPKPGKMEDIKNAPLGDEGAKVEEEQAPANAANEEVAPIEETATSSAPEVSEEETVSVK